MHACSVVCEVARWPTIEPEWLPLLFIRLAALAEVSSRPRTHPAPTQDSCKDMHSSSGGSGVTSGIWSEESIHAVCTVFSVHIVACMDQSKYQA